MSDQGDTGPWRPATSQNDQHSTPDETTGPLPAISGDEADAPGFPSVSGSSESWSATDDDDAPTGGFPAVSPRDPQASAGRSPFEPAERPERSFEFTPEPEDPGPEGTTPAFGTQVHGTRPASGSFGSSSFDEPSEPSEAPAPSSEPSFGSSYFGESSFGSGASSLGSSSFGESSFGTKPYGESSYGSGSSDETPETRASGPSSPEGDSSATGSFAPPPPVKGVSAEDEAAENDFFASDDHPPMWDKVVAPSGPPPKPGKPSSGNLRLPDWMRDEGGAGGGLTDGPVDHEDEGHSRRPLFVGVGILVAGLLAVGGVYVMKGNGDSRVSNAAAPTRSTATPSQAATRPAKSQSPATKPLPRFKGVHTKAVGRVADARSGLSYPRFAKPWALPAKRSPMSELGFSASQFAVTEKTGAQPKRWARLMSAELAGAAKDAYSGPGTERDAANQVAQMYEARMYAFRHKKRVLASQPLNIGGRKGWLVSDYLTYRRPGVKATGDVVAVALVDTGRKAPGILFMSVPNTNKKLWPDVNFVVRSLRVS